MQTNVNNLPFVARSHSEFTRDSSQIGAPKFWGPKFGCRLMAFMTEESEPSKMAADLLAQATLKNPNCIKNQSASRHSSPVRDGITSPYDEEDLAQRPQKGNGDGWGVVSYRGNLMNRRRVSLLPAHLDSSFDISVQDAIASKPKTMLVHLLKNGKDRLPNPWNLHPFVYENWSGMLNGGLKAINKGVFNQELQDSTFPILGELPKGTTAGEAGLYLFLGRLKKQFGTLSTDEIPFEQVERVFGQTIQDIMAKSPPEFETFSDPETGIQGTLESKPASNFVVTDGKTLLAFRHGRNLFVGRQVLPNGKSQYLISSEVLMPIPFQPPVKWLQVPEDTILSLTQTPEGKINARFKPLSQIS